MCQAYCDVQGSSRSFRAELCPSWRPVRAAGLLLLLLLLILPLRALANPVVDAEVENLRETAKNLAIAAATRGNGVRGASAYLDSMLRQSDQLICNSWILGFSISVRRMAVKLGDSPSPKELQAYRALVQLRDKIVKNCGKIVDSATHTAMRGGADSTGGEPAEPESSPPKGRPFVPRTNWNIVDQICWDRCSRPYYAYRRAAREAQKRQEGLQRARQAAVDAKRALDAKKREFARLEAEAKTHQAESDLLQGRLRRASGSSRSPIVEALGDALRDRNMAQAAAGRAREAIARLRKAWKQAQQDEARAARLAQGADADATSALLVYRDCVKRCYASAQKAGQGGAARDLLSDNPSTPGTSKDDRRSMLERLRAVRQEEEQRSARQSARAARGAQALRLERSPRRSLVRLPAPMLGTAGPVPEPIRRGERPEELREEEPLFEAKEASAAAQEAPERRPRGMRRRPSQGPRTERSPTQTETSQRAESMPGPQGGRMIRTAPPTLSIPVGTAGR